ncbi:MAG: nucleotidyl transferase AbiEii/AbiGii toxin family protein [bacterium]
MHYIDIFRKFNENKVKYFVIGGLAVNFHGLPRFTYDIDILIEMEDENIKRLIDLLTKWGYKPKVPVNPYDFAIKEIRDSWINDKNMKAFNFYNDKAIISEIDIIIESPVSYKDGIKNAVIFDAEGIAIPVISLGDLVKMKRKANRDIDLYDIKHLGGNYNAGV